MGAGRFGASLLALGLAACATTPTANINTFAERSADNSFEAFDRSVESNALVLPVVHDRQTSRVSCGAHALASIINYWQGAETASGAAIYAAEPPGDERGYSLAELTQLAHEHGLMASSVRLDRLGLVRELEAGRPVLVPVRVPAIYVEGRTLPGANEPVVGLANSLFSQRAGAISEFTRLGLVDHYVVVVGYDSDRIVVVEPVMGYRTISYARLERYRENSGDAALVISAPAGRR